MSRGRPAIYPCRSGKITRMSGGGVRIAVGLCLLLAFAAEAGAQRADDGRPVLVSPPVLSSSTAASGTPISTTTGSWTNPGGTQLAFTFQWQSCSTAGDNCKDIVPSVYDNARQPTYVPAGFAAGTTIRAAVTAWNLVGATTAYTAVAALPPLPLPPTPPPGPPSPRVNPLELTATVSPGPAVAGGTFNFTTVVSYGGFDNLAGATFVVGPLHFMQVVSYTTSTGSCDVGNSEEFTCRLDSLEFGKPATVSVVIRALKPGTYRLNSVTTLGNTSATSPVVAVDVAAPTADIAVLAPLVVRARTGKILTALVRIVNIGPETAAPVLQLEPSAGIEVVGASPYVGCVFGRCRLTQLGSGSSAVVALKLRALRSGTLTARSMLANSFAADPVSANDTALMRIVARHPR